MSINNISGIIGKILGNEMNKTQLELIEAFERLSTGQRINSASDDPAGLAIASRLDAQVRALGMAERNAQMGIGMVRTAEGYLSGVTEDVQRIRELGVQAANGTLTDIDRAAIQDEITALRENISYTLSSAQFNTKNLFDGHTESLQIGPNASSTMQIEFPALSLESLGLDEIDVSTQAGAEASITATSGALDDVLSVRASFGAYENRLESALGSIGETRLNTLKSLSEIMDADMAVELIKASTAATKLEAQMMVTAQVLELQAGIIPHLLGQK